MGSGGAFRRLVLYWSACRPCLGPHAVSWAELCGPPGTHTGFLCSQQVNMPYVMIPAFPPSHQPLPVAPDSQLALPIQPIPCKPGEWGWGCSH